MTPDDWEELLVSCVIAIVAVLIALAVGWPVGGLFT